MEEQDYVVQLQLSGIVHFNNAPDNPNKWADILHNN